MIKASDLVKQQHEKDKRKFDTYNKIYKKIEKKISLESAANNYYTLYEIPELILGIPLFNVRESSLYIKKQLEKNGFKVDHYDPNKLLITWLPS
jgi:hypothetical protein